MSEDSIYINFGKMLYLLRIKNGLTRKELAEELGVALTTYAQYERGVRRIPLEHVVTLSELLGFDIDEFAKNQKEPDKISYGKKWDEEFEGVNFTPEEITEIIMFAKFIIWKRDDAK